MRIVITFFIAGLMIPAASWAAGKKRVARPKPAAPAAAVTVIEAPVEPAQPPPRTSSQSIGLSAVTWHESIGLTQGDEKSKMLAQFKGVLLGFDLNVLRPYSRWHYQYGLDLGAGVLKGQGASPVNDRFNNQSFYLGTVRIGMVFRATTVSRAGIFIPFSYRQMKWSYEPGTITKATDEHFSTGIGGVFQLRFNARTTVQATLVHQHMWNANQWGVGANLEL